MPDSTRGAPPSAALAERRARTAAAAAQGSAVGGVTVTAGDLAGVPVLRCHPDAGADRLLLWFHGGGYRLGSAAMFRTWTSHLALATGAQVVSVDYRLAPEHPFPEALLDASLTWSALLAAGIAPQQAFVGGDSAGGGLAAALLLSLAARDLPFPAGAVLCSPWLDLRNTAGSFAANAATDELFSQASADEAAGLYLAGHPADDPLVSPVLGDWTGLPPVLVQASDTEVLCDDARALAAAADTVRLEVFEGLPHVWHLGYPATPGAVAAVESISRFIAEVAPARVGAHA